MAEPTLDRKSSAEIQDMIATIMKMVLLGALFAAVGYLLILGALFLELTQFHPLLEEFFSSFTNQSLAGGPDRAGQAALNAQLAEIHQFPSTLLWMKLGGIGHILVGIFIVLAGINRGLALMPHRLSYELEKLQE